MVHKNSISDMFGLFQVLWGMLPPNDHCWPMFVPGRCRPSFPFRFFGHMLPAPVLLGGVASTRQEAVKTVQEPPSQASNHGDDESRQHEMDQISWRLRCAQASLPAVAMFLATCVSAVGWKCSDLLGKSLSEDPSSFILIWALAGSNTVAGMAATWSIAPTQHVLLASRFLMPYWFGGLFCIFAPTWRSVVMFFEVICLQYLIHDRFRRIWPDLSSPRKGISLQHVLWLEAGLLCCMASASGLNICMLSQISTDLVPRPVQPGEAQPRAFEEMARLISSISQYVSTASLLAVLYLVYWACRVLSTLCVE